MDIPSVEEVFHVSISPPLESMVFDADISDVVAKIRSAIVLEGIVRLHKLTKIH